MSELKWVGKAVPRIDAEEKATGELKYMSDLSFPHMLWGRVLRAAYPHALIKSIDTSGAEALPGVAAVLTHKDVPGLNGFGIVIPDQPVLCYDKVRYLGDAVALVAAETKEIAEQALRLIKVEYEPLPVVSDLEEAIKPESVKVHKNGNIHQYTHVKNGDVEKAFAEADLIIENTYYSPRQMHSFLETESGVGLCDENGNLTIYCGSQHPYRDQLQVARAMKLNPKKIRIISTPAGGAFGGKDEITLQIYLALLAQKTRRPVKMVLSREESVIAGMKRHPMKVTVKTAAKKDGTLLANKVRILADTGAYASLGGPVVNLAVEHCCGPYRIPNVDLEGYCIYTNNGLAGAFRGFGANQTIFAMETQMNLLAEKLGIDPIELRLKNVVHQGEKAALGHTMTAAVGAERTLLAARECDLWQNREEYKKNSSKPWKKRGIGLATELHGCGLGVGLPDYGAAVIELTEDGTFKVGASCPEIGQGNFTAWAQIAAESLHTNIAEIHMYPADTGLVPDSGSCTASRGVYTGGNAIVNAAGKMVDLLCAKGAELLQVDRGRVACENGRVVDKGSGRAISYPEIARALPPEERKVEGDFVWPTADKAIEGAFGLPHLIYTYITQMALVEVNTLTGETEVLKAVSIPDCGRVINRQGLEGQSEGGTVMGIGYALMEDTIIEEGQFKTRNFSTYILPTALDAPPVETIIVEELEPSGPYGGKGVGEAVCVPITPAVTWAIHDAVGVVIDHIPATAERVYRKLKELQVSRP